MFEKVIKFLISSTNKAHLKKKKNSSSSAFFSEILPNTPSSNTYSAYIPY